MQQESTNNINNNLPNKPKPNAGGLSYMGKLTLAAILLLVAIVAAFLFFRNDSSEVVVEKTDIGSFSKDVVLGEYAYNDLNTLPSVQLIVSKDSNSGYNINLVTNNFTFTPTKTGFSHTDGEGHAYIFVNGERIERLYSDWVHIPSLNAGDEITVTLNTNDHKVYTFNSQVVGASTTIGNTIEF